MNQFTGKKILAGILSTVLLCSAAPSVLAVSNTQFTATSKTAVQDSDIIFSTGFEDGEGLSEFTGRGGVEVIEASSVAYSGDSAMCVSGREKSWNGPQLLLDERCEAGVEYLVSAHCKTEWYSTINLSMEYTDSEGERHYSNLKSAQSDQWVEFTDIKVSFTEDVTNVYVYVEASDTCNLYVDDFELKAAPIVAIQDDIASLKDVYAGYFDVGTAITPSNLTSKSFMNLVTKHFSDCITVGNELKPDYVLNKTATQAYVEETGDDTNPKVSLASARSLLKYCSDNNIPLRGHTLVWHSQTPDWFFKEGFADDGDWVTKEKMIERMENYIKNVMETIATEYPDLEVYAWDVVNEAWSESGTPRAAGSNNETNGSSAWVKVFGDNSFIEYAFKFARQYAPEGCKLYYNDYNEYMQQKMDAIYEMALDLKEKGLIDGIGMQSHLDVGFPTAAQYKKALEKYASTGLDIQITELDITTSDTSEAGLEKQAQVYSDIFDAIVEYKDSVSAVILWGVTDDASWRADRVPLIFDEDYQAKPAYYSIVDGIEPLEPTKPPVTTVPSTVGDILWGDANEDDDVNLADAIFIMQSLANSSKYTLSAQGLENADVYMNGDGVNAQDALSIQKYDTGLIDSLPETN